ncbi:nitrate reductase [Comamonas terrigena]|uniref:nitrate reductase n=1 Tax=Comamonas terrigena TaxID=32013 RepID=UPI00289FBE4C|nr:molybdopterin-dependent oxidoreductase [Comamonas terrigena]
MAETRSTCPYCGVGCGVIIQSEGTQITGVRGDPLHPANHGRLCTKGSTLHLTAAPALARQTRLLQPLLRAGRGQAPQPIDWDTALDLAATRMADTVQQHGPDAVAIYASGQLLTEDYYVFNKLAKGLLGTNNLDTNSRLCMSSAVAGYKATLGADAPPACYDDLQHARCLFIVGSNAAWAHPILFRRIEDAKAANPQLRIIVADPRRTETAEIADLFLPLQPGTDVQLFHGMLHAMLWEGWLDTDYIARHTSGFDDLKALVREATPERVARDCGLDMQDVLQAARWFALGGEDGSTAQRAPTLSLYCQGLNQSSSGTAKNAALINLHLATGQIGKQGAGPLSLTGQPNAMGGREVGGMANLLSAHRDLANAQHRAEVAAFWGVPSVPASPGKTAIELFEAAADGQIKALWIACTNPAHSLPDQATVRRALERAEWVVLQDAFATTATAAYADLLLPATTWGEKLGTVTNSERRISRVRAAVPAPGQARHDWQIATQIAQRIEARLRPGQPSLFAYDTRNAAAGAERIWNEHRDSTRGRDLDITGLSWPLLESAGPQQWPLPAGAQAGTERLYADGIFPTADGRARFAAQPYRPVAEPRSARFPFSLNTGRLRDQWHGMSRTGQLGRLFAHQSEPVLNMHPQDMERSRLQPGQLVAVRSHHGQIVLPVQADTGLGLSQVYLPMHWGSEYLSGRDAQGQAVGGVNALTTPAFCPQSKQPELKHAAVSVQAVDLPWSLLARVWLPPERVLAARQQLAALLPAFDFASCVPFGENGALEQAAGARQGLLLRAACATAPDAALLQHVRQLLQLEGPDLLHYADAQRGHSRTLRLRAGSGDTAGQTWLDGLLLCGDTRAGGWLSALLEGDAPLQLSSRTLLSPGAEPPSGLASARSVTVCSCWGVGEQAITQTLHHCRGSDAQRLEQLQNQLKCGTQCGSCLPRLRQLVRDSAQQALPA